MSDEFFFDGARYISANDAASYSDVTRDYVARLCRDGKVQGKRVGKNWYVRETSLKAFLVQREYASAARSQELAESRVREYKAAHANTEPAKAISVSAHVSAAAADIKSQLAHALTSTDSPATHVLKAPPGIGNAVLSATHVPVYAISPAIEFVHKLLALTLAFSLTFGTFTLVNPSYAQYAVDATRDEAHAIADSVRNFNAPQLAQATQDSLTAAAADPVGTLNRFGTAVSNLARSWSSSVDSFVYAIAFPDSLTGSSRGSVAVSITPYPGAGSLTKNIATSQTVINNPVVSQTVQTETERIITESGISEAELDLKLNQLENKLASKMYSVSAAGSSAVYSVVSQTNHIDHLTDATLNNPTINGGSTSGTQIGASSLSVSGASTLATTTVNGDLTVNGSVSLQNISLASSTISISGQENQSTNLIEVKDASGTILFAVQPDGTLLTTNASSTQIFTSLLIAGGATTTSLYSTRLDTLTASTTFFSSLYATTTNLFATSTVFVNATSTNLFASLISFTNASGTNATTTNFFATNASTTNATSTNFFAATASSTNLFAQTATIGTLNISSPITAASGGLGTSTWQTNSIPYFNGARFTESNSAFNFDGTRLNMTFASSTSITASGTGYFGNGAFTNTSGTTTIASGQGFTIGSSQFVLQQGSGNVGIGTSSPSAKLHVQANNGSNIFTLANQAGGNAAVVRVNSDGSGSFRAYDNLGNVNAILESGDITQASGGTLGWTNSATNGAGTIDTAFSRLSAGVIGFGTGAAASTAGGFLAASSTILGNFTVTGTASTTGSAYFGSTVGIGTTTPFGKFALSLNNGETYTGDNGFIIASSTAGATSTLFVVKDSGNVGIGTGSPTNLLNVQGTDNTGVSFVKIRNTNGGSGAYADLTLNNDGSGATKVGIGGTGVAVSGSDSDGAFSYLIANNNSSGLNIAAEKTTAGIKFFTGGADLTSERVRIDSSGNIGFGTTTPFGKFALSLKTGETYSGNNAFIIASSTTGATTTLFLVQNNGNVGIGTSSPAFALDVNGTGSLTNLRVGTSNTAGGSLNNISTASLQFGRWDTGANWTLVSQGGFRVRSDAAGYGFSATTASDGNADVNLSRLSAGVVAFGTGPALSTAGGFIAASSTISGGLFTAAGGASTTNITASGTGNFATASTTALIIGTPSSILSTASNGTVQALSVDTSLSFSANSLSLNMANPNSWTALQQFNNSTSSLFSATTKAYFGSSGQSSFNSSGVLSLGTALGQSSGGTGISSYSPGDIIYADSGGTLTALHIGSATNVLTVQAGLPAWGTSAGGNGGSSDTLWATTTNNLAQYPVLTSRSVIIGASATSSTTSIFEVSGQSYFSSNLGIATTAPATKLSVAGNTYITGGLGVGVLNSTAGTLQTTGNATIGGTLLLTALSTNILLYNDGSNQVAAATIDPSLSFSTGTLSLNLSHANSWAALQTLGSGFVSQSSSTIVGAGTITGAATLGSTLALSGLGTFATGFLSNSSSTITSGLFTMSGGASTTNITGSGTGYFGLGAFTNTSGTTTIATGQGFTIGSSQLVLQQGTGNLGIGTTSPAQALTIGSGGILVNRDAADPFISFSSAGAAAVGKLAALSLGNYLYFASAAGTPYFVVNTTGSNAGNVGIGTTSPQTKLEVVDSSAASTTPFYISNFNSGTSSTKVSLAFRTDDITHNTGTSTASIFSIFQGGTGGVPQTANGDLALATLRSGSLTEALRITSAGNVGIGTSSPSTTFGLIGSQYLTGGLGVGVLNASAGTLQTSGAATIGGLLTLSNGFLANASSTITTGLFTMSGGASTTNLSVSSNTYFPSSGIWNASGNVGIGTTTTLWALAAASSTGPQIALVDTTGNSFAWTMRSISNNFYLATSTYGATSTVAALGINSSGNATFGNNLTVNGTLLQTGLLTLSNGFLANASSTITTGLFTMSGGASTTNITGSGTGYFGLGAFTNTSGTTTIASGQGFTIGSSQFVLQQSTGNVGIGTTTPSALLQVEGGGATFAGVSKIVAQFVDNAVMAANVGPNLAFSGNDGTGLARWAAIGGHKENATSGNDAGYINFYTRSGGNLTERMRIDSSGNIGIGTTTPGAILDVYKTSSGATADVAYFTNADRATSTAERINFRAVDTSGTGTTTSAITSILQQNFVSGQGDLAFSVLNAGALTEAMRIANTGNVGVGTTTPNTILSVSKTASTPQLSVGYDTTDDFEARVDSTGNTNFRSSGKQNYFVNDNLWVCTGGSITSNACPSGNPTGQGNLVVANRIGIGTSTVGSSNGANAFTIDLNNDTTSNLINIGTSTSGYGTFTSRLKIDSVGRLLVGTTSAPVEANFGGRIFVGANSTSAVTLGTATSTFNGDIKILGKLDVGTIDPVYTIDGTKYATYGESAVGVHEETLQTIDLTHQDPTTGKYVYTIAFDTLARGSDLWVFYQITDFGDQWQNLNVQLTPAFDGAVFYTKVPGAHTLLVQAEQPGEVSMRLSGNRFDFTHWGTLRPDQNDKSYPGFKLQSKPQTAGAAAALEGN